MPRSPTDATRFTATGPYAASSTSFASNQNVPAASAIGSRLNIGSAPAGETAQQKIARLRAAAAASRRGPESQFDRVVKVGRVWADRAHRFTALGLIGLTVVAGAVATAGITDMLLHNRRRRNEWFAEQRARSAKDLADARAAQTLGAATEDQVLLINRERAAEEAAEAKKNRPGVFKRTTDWMFSGLSKEEQKGGKLGAITAATEDTFAHVKEEAKERLPGQQHDRSTLQVVEDKLDAHRRQGERIEEVAKPLGGPLDRQAAYAASALSSAGQSWQDWVLRR